MLIMSRLRAFRPVPLLLALVASLIPLAWTGGALADPGRPGPGFHRPDGGGRMSWEDRQRLRDDLRRGDAPHGFRDVRKERAEGERRERAERMTPEERQRLRDDLRNFERQR